MRNTRLGSLLGRAALRAVLAGGLCLCGWGCHQHHYYYYGNSPAGACPPGTVMPSTTTAGPLCEVPSDVGSGGTTINSSSARSTIIDDGRKPRVVVSEPSGGSKSRFYWRPSDPDASPAMTQVEGGIEDSSVRK
jgi:hypothetical protein